MSEPEDRAANEADDFDPGLGADFVDDIDEGIAGEIAADEAFNVGTQHKQSRSAWQRLETRREEAWLKEQLSDWDDWDGDAEPH